MDEQEAKTDSRKSSNPWLFHEHLSVSIGTREPSPLSCRFMRMAAADLLSETVGLFRRLVTTAAAPPEGGAGPAMAPQWVARAREPASGTVANGEALLAAISATVAASADLPPGRRLQRWGWKPLGKKALGRRQVSRWVCFAADDLAPALAERYAVPVAATSTTAPEADSPADGGAAAAAAPVLKAWTVLPPLPLLELNEHVRTRDWLCGSEQAGGYLSAADIAMWVVLRRWAAELMADMPVLHQLPQIQRWFRAVSVELDHAGAFDGAEAPADLGEPELAKGERRPTEEYVMRASASSAARQPATATPEEVAARLAGAGVAPAVGEVAVTPTAWTELHPTLDPGAGGLSDHRAARKRQQIDNLRELVARVVGPGDTIVEFGAGGGHVGLVLAAAFPECSVMLLDRRQQSLARAQQRAKASGLRNVTTFYGDVCEFDREFDVGVGLHCCGVFTDVALWKCVERGAAYVFCPCCYGKIGAGVAAAMETASIAAAAAAAPPMARVPRSRQFTELGISAADFLGVTQICDYSPTKLHTEALEVHDLLDPKWKRAKLCMGLVDRDRNMWAEEQAGYRTEIVTMVPATCSPKNNMVVGWPPGWTPRKRRRTQ